ncbi:DUF4390 domain-containing protein [Pseudomonadota bacterium]
MTCLNIKSPLPGWVLGLTSILLLMFCLLNTSLANAEEEEFEPAFTVLSVESRIEDEVVRLDAIFDLEFSEKLVEALHNGVPLTLLVELKVMRERSYWLSETIAEIEQRFQISFNPLTGRYLFHNLNSDAKFQLPNFDVVKLVLSHLSNFPLLDYSLLEEDMTYNARARIRVDDEKFPVPLRLMTYVTSDWDLVSEWYEWQLQ